MQTGGTKSDTRKWTAWFIQIFKRKLISFFSLTHSFSPGINFKQIIQLRRIGLEFYWRRNENENEWAMQSISDRRSNPSK